MQKEVRRLKNKSPKVSMETENEEHCYNGAFIQKFILEPTNPSAGAILAPLKGLTFAVKDIFDVEGYVTGFGNVDWGKTHAAATTTAPTVAALLQAGATCLGKTVMDEMAYSINGENYHYGTPTNPAAADRVPGGSSSGSAVAVAAGLVHFSLGTDTGGSVRVPAAYCGIFGFRPSHDIISTLNVIPMAQSFDTVGWFANDPLNLCTVGKVLLSSQPNEDSQQQQPTQIIVPEDCFKLLDSLADCDLLTHIITTSAEKMYGCNIVKHLSLGDYIFNEVPSLCNVLSKTPDSQISSIPALGAISYVMRSLQRLEFKSNHGEWIEANNPTFGPGISERVAEALGATDANVGCYLTFRDELRAALTALLQNYGVIAIPTVPGPPPKLNTEPSELENFRTKAFCLLSIAGISGFCQVTIPLGMHNSLPVSVSLLARHGADAFLLNVANSLSGTLKQEASSLWNLRS